MLDIKNLILSSPHKTILNNISLSVSKNETIAIVGESGSGKTTLLKLLLGLPLNGLKFERGKLTFLGRDIYPQEKRQELSFVGTDLAWMSQHGQSHFNPRRKIKTHYQDLVKHYKKRGRLYRELDDCLKMVGLTSEIADKYPFELSGGMMQRVSLALSLSSKMKLLLADEPTSSLDVISKLELIKLLKRLKKEEGLSMILVTHDMTVARELADRIIIMKNGEMIEQGKIDDILTNPEHPYSKKLIQSVPRLRQF